MYEYDKRIVLTLDAGGTNFVFSAIQACKEIIEPICIPAISDNIESCLSILVQGFNEVKAKLDASPVAISFAFPGPADYEHGIIGDLPNFPAFRGGVALGAYLEKKFAVPVYINNDGNLFAYGEALVGALPQINAQLKAAGNPKRYKNLLGLTLGTGFGAGVVINNELLTGDNGCGGDVWIFRNCYYQDKLVEENVSIRAVKRVYQELARCTYDSLTPKDIYDIAEGKIEGDKNAAISSFSMLGKAAGNAVNYALTLIDGVVVIGGGLSGAAKYIMPSFMETLREQIGTFSGESFPILQMKPYYLNNQDELTHFLTMETSEVQVPESDDKVTYYSEKKTGIVLSPLGANVAISMGAYAFALYQLDYVKNIKK